MENTPILKFKTNTDYSVMLRFNKPDTGTNDYGPWNRYGVTHEGNDASIFASAGLHKQLSLYGAGSTVNIRKEEYDAGKTKFIVTSDSPISQPSQSINSSPTVTNDARTHDIHKQVCLKLAVQLLHREDNGTLSDGERVVIEANLNYLLDILEGTKESQEEDLPF
jgi:hypothetical protein